MKIRAYHWITALSVAAAAHIAALLWLSQPTARIDPPRVTTGIVIALEDKATLLSDTASPSTPSPERAKDPEVPDTVSEHTPTGVATQPAPTAADEPRLKQIKTDPPQPATRLSPQRANEPAIEAMANVTAPRQENEIPPGVPTAMPHPSLVANESRIVTISGDDPSPQEDKVDPSVTGAALPPTAVSEPEIKTLSGVGTSQVASSVGTATTATSSQLTQSIQGTVPADEVGADTAKPASVVATMQLEAIHAGEAMNRDLPPIEASTPSQDSLHNIDNAIEHASVKDAETLPPGTPAEFAPLAPSENVTAHVAPTTAINPVEQQRVLGVTARYAGLLKGWLQRHMRYPREAWLAGIQGTTVLRFSIDRDGKVIASSLEQSSGHNVLDREAVQMVRRADPFPAIPYEIVGNELELRVPIVFFIKDFERQREMPPIYLK